MRILVAYNAHRHGGGSDAVAKRTAELLTQAGHSVVVFTRSSKELSGWRGSLRAFLFGIYSPRADREFARVLDEFRPDVVHAHEVYPLITPWIFRSCARRRVPAVMTCHDYRLSCPIATHFRCGGLCFECAGGHEFRCLRHNCCRAWFKSLAYALRSAVARRLGLFGRYVDLFLTPSEQARALLCRYAGLAPDRVLPVGNPVPAVSNEEAPEFVRGEYVAYAGRFEPEKGFDLLVAALAGAGLPLKVAGDASGYLSSRRTVPEHVEFTGHLDRHGMSRFYQQARLLVAPSLCHETFGLVVAEALACATPVVVSDLGSLFEVAGPGGLVVPAGDAGALREAVSALWNDERLCRQLGLAGREHVKQYSDEAYVSNVLSAYGRITGAAHTRADA